MKTILLFLLLVSTGFAAEYSVKYNADYSYVVDLSGGKLKNVYLAKNEKEGLARIPQTVRMDGLKFSILCDLYSKTPDGATRIALSNVEGEVSVTKDFKPKIGENIGILLKKDRASASSHDLHAHTSCGHD